MARPQHAWWDSPLYRRDNAQRQRNSSIERKNEVRTEILRARLLDNLPPTIEELYRLATGEV